MPKTKYKSNSDNPMKLGRPMIWRLVWLALLLSELSFFFLTMEAINRGAGPHNPQIAADSSRTIRIVDLVMLMILVPGAYLMRKHFYSRFRDEQTGAVI